MTYDIIGIGIGPFNLGLAALAHSIPNLKCVFFDQHESFNWHPGLLLDDARLQVPFYADLVTLADPCSPFNYLAYLKANQRLFRFAIRENYFPTRREYNEYGQWVARQLSSLKFGHRCISIDYDPKTQTYAVQVSDRRGQRSTFHGKHLVIGTGTMPSIPAFAEAHLSPLVFHSGDYLFRKPGLLDKKHISLVGSGQSAAEIFYDLLQHTDQIGSLRWFTRSERFHPMEYSKLTLEMTSPDYIDYFYRLSPAKKKNALAGQHNLYKGINFSLINAIYDKLYSLRTIKKAPPVALHTNSELTEITALANGEVQLSFYQSETENAYTYPTEALILATGYTYQIPDFLQSIQDRINWTPDGLYDVGRNYSISKEGYTIFVQNAELHTHGFNAPDLGMGPYRNSIILNTIIGHEHFALEKGIAFQNFGAPVYS
jgi:lysine N6-hydroxylase